MKKRFRKKRIWSNRGTTLVEMIVCFALLGILMITAIDVLGSAMSTYRQVKQNSDGREVTELLANSIEGELSSANVSKKVPDIKNHNAEIFFYDKQNRPVKILAEDGYLLYSYGTKTEESRWKLDPNVYKGYKIESLTFVKVFDPANPNADETDDEDNLDPNLYAKDIYKLVIRVHSEKNGDYESVRYISCRNMR